MALTVIEQQLAAGEAVERETPFVQRTLDLMLNGEWIGDAIAYGCYRKGQAPGASGPTEEQILEDLTIISQHWKLVRVYGADDDTERILRVITRHNLAVKVTLGIWLENETGLARKRQANMEQVLRGIALAQRYGAALVAINVGNETQVSWAAHRMDESDLIRYIRAVRNSVAIPVTTADDWSYWVTNESRTIADEIDFVFTHIHPLWNGQTLSHAMPWADSIYRAVSNMHPSKVTAIGEIGWATEYDATKQGPGEQGSLIKGEVSVDAQGRFLAAYSEWMRRNTVASFLFEMFDEPWKGGGDLSSPAEVEKHWGLFYEDRSPKESFQKFSAQQ